MEYTEYSECFTDLKPGQPVLIAREAAFVHRRGITKKDLQLMKDNFDNNVVQMRIDFDYDHKEDPAKGRKAAGWVKSLSFGEVVIDGKKHAALFANPEWTPEAARAIKDGEYAYTSPEIFWEWTHPENGKKYNSVLRSIAILNRPQIPGQPSIKLSEAKITKEVFKVEKIKELLEKNGAAKFADEITEDVIVNNLSEIFAAKDKAVKLSVDEVEKLKSKLAEIEKEKANIEKELGKYKEDIAKVEAERFTEKLAALVEKAKEKMPPAMAEGMFKALAEKDIVAAETYLNDIKGKFGEEKPEGNNAEGGVEETTELKEYKAVSKMREELAAERKVSVDEVEVSEAYREYAKKVKEAK